MSRKSTALAAWVFAAAVAAATPAALAQQAGTKTAVVDMQRLARESDAGKSVLAQVRKMQTDYQQTLTSEQQEIQQGQQKLNEERTTLAPDVFQQKIQELGQKYQGYQRNLQQHQAQLDVAFRNAEQTVTQAVLKIVEAIEKEQKLGMVIERASVIGTTSAPDITPEVLKRLNQQLSSVPVELPQ